MCNHCFDKDGSVEEPSSQTTDKEELSPSVGVRVVESGAKEENMKT